MPIVMIMSLFIAKGNMAERTTPEGAMMEAEGTAVVEGMTAVEGTAPTTTTHTTPITGTTAVTCTMGIAKGKKNGQEKDIVSCTVVFKM